MKITALNNGADRRAPGIEGGVYPKWAVSA
jgi:hypothetical protein